ncbi:MAG: hypothetical protein CV082_10795 [Candidatus Brocadia sp. BL1]|nr:MAG: hypothetical protein CV082_10795 [Candidatus Brocadia sp. BL1]
MVADMELLRCLHCGETYRPDPFYQDKGTRCSGCGMKLIPLVTDKTIAGDANELIALLGYFGIIALVGAVGGIMVVHGWNFWVTFVMLGGIIFFIAKLFIEKYKIDRTKERISSKYIPDHLVLGRVPVFDQLVAEAMNELPESLKDRLSNVSVVIEDQPSNFIVKKFGLTKNKVLLGLFQGVPLNKKSVWQSVTMPERITIFQRNIENLCHSDAEIKQKIKEVVRHEVAHFVGFTEDGIKEMGY